MTPERPSDPPKETVQTDLGPIAYSDQGNGPVLLAIHGLPGSGRDFRWLATVVEPSVRFVRIDMPGFGDSPRRAAPGASIPARAAAAMAAADALGLQRFNVLGHSIGGPVALEIAARNPQRVCGLALLSSVGLRPHRLLRGSHLGLISAVLRLPGGRVVLRRLMRNSFRRSGFPASTPEAELVQSVHCAAALDFDRNADNVRRLQVPAFLAWAADDPLVEDAIGRGLAQACGDCVTRRFDSGGHNIQKSRAVEIGEALAQWLHQVVMPACTAAG